MMKDIEGYEGKYAVTDDGRVWSYKSHIFLSEKIAKNQYRQVCLYNNGQKKMFYIHQLVAQTFIPNPEHLSTVNHKDFNKGNNKVENLEWLSRYDNIQHYWNAVREAKSNV